MKINNCFKNFHSGISKVISPQQTCAIVLKKFRTHKPLIVDRYFEVKRPTGIPQYYIEGSEHYQEVLSNFCFANQGQNGKGHFKQQALASGLMELAERYSFASWMLDDKNICKMASFRELRKNLFTIEDFYSNFNKDFVTLLGNIGTDSIKIEWRKGYTINGELVYLPHLLLCLLGSTGLAAGNSFEEAILHGICEVIERHCQTLIEIHKIETPTIQNCTIVSPIACILLRKFAALKKQKIIIKDFSLDFPLPVIGVIRTLNDDTCTITVGVATTPEEALIRALTESSQTEGEPGRTIEQRCAKHHFTNKKVISIDDIPDISNRNIRTEIKTINRLLLTKKMKPVFVDTTNKMLNISSVFVHIQKSKDIFFGITGMTNRDLTNFFLRNFIRTGNYTAFEKLLKEALGKHYINKTAEQYFRGMLLERKSKYKKAISYFLKIYGSLNKLSKKKFKEIIPFSCFFVNVGLCYLAMGDKDTAFNYYLKNIELQPDFNIGKLTWNCKNIKLPENNKKLFEEAVHLYEQAEICYNLFRKGKYKTQFR